MGKKKYFEYYSLSYAVKYLLNTYAIVSKNIYPRLVFRATKLEIPVFTFTTIQVISKSVLSTKVSH